MSSTTLHYIWIGAPTRLNLKSIPGHDVAGPIAMARKILAENRLKINPIKFWCLNKYQEFFEIEFLKFDVVIEVCSVETLIEQNLITELGAEAFKMQQFMQAIHFPALVTTSQRVQFKDAFSLFLLACEGGYFFDTNITPLTDALQLNGHDQALTVAADGGNDYYLMYAPADYDQQFRQAFNNWITDPCVPNLQAFDGTNIPNTLQPINLSIKKTSFNSWFTHAYSNHFYWVHIHPQQAKNKLAYSDVNRQMKSDFIYPLQSCSMLYVKPDAELNVSKLPITTATAYVAYRHDIYFINKLTRKWISGKGLNDTNLCAFFPCG